MVAKTKKTISLGDADHPDRRKAIAILEYLLNQFKREPKGERWYELEDAITNIIYAKAPKFAAHQDEQCPHDSTHFTHDGTFCADCGIQL
jgi:hypothetical protein